MRPVANSRSSARRDVCPQWRVCCAMSNCHIRHGTFLSRCRCRKLARLSSPRWKTPRAKHRSGSSAPLGARGDVALCQCWPLAVRTNQESAVAVARALGQMPSSDAIKTLRRPRRPSGCPSREAAVDGLFRHANRLVFASSESRALSLYAGIYNSEKANGVRVAAYGDYPGHPDTRACD